MPSGVAGGLLHVAGLGLHRTTLDGEPVSDARLESGITDFSRRIIHSSYPVSLAPGRSVLGIELGRGFHSMTTPNVWGWHTAPWRGPRMALVELELLAADGTVLGRVVSDGQWQGSQSGTRFDSLYEGETFDATRHPHGWDSVGFEVAAGTGWSPVRIVPAPAAELVHQRHEPIRITETAAVQQWHGGSGAPLVADFGQQFAGWVRIEAPAVPAGTTITVRLAEKADATGVQLANEHVQSDRLDMLEFVVADGLRSWEPRFTWTGFRFAEVSGIDHPDQIRLTACRAHTDVASVSQFSSGQEVLDWIDAAMRSTVRNNLHHLPTDTPVYEKNGWVGDAHVALPAMLHQFDLQHLLVKWLDDLADGQTAEGQLPVIAPTPGWGYLEAPEWTTLYPYLIDQLDLWYGLPKVVARHRESMLRFLRRELSRTDPDGLVDGILGDYLAPGTLGNPTADDLRMAASCHLVRGLRAGAAVLSRHGEDPATVAHLTGAADAMAAAINEVLLDTTVGYYRSEREPHYRQTTNILPVAFGITPDAWVQPVVDRLAAEIAARGNRHDAGCLGLAELFGVLSRHGHAELAMAVATGREAPSWGAWMAAGETTMVEMWGPGDRSHNHYFMGSMARWLYSDVAGVRMLRPQWRAFEVDPRVRDGLDRVAFRLRTVQGELAVRWEQLPERFDLAVSVPEGSAAIVRLPDGREIEVGPGDWDWSCQREAAAAR